MLVEPGALVPQIVGADDRRVAAGIAEPDRAAFHDRNFANPVLLGEIIGGGEPVAATADDDDLIARFRRRFAPHRPPAAMPAERLPRQREKRKPLHRGRLAPYS